MVSSCVAANIRFSGRGQAQEGLPITMRTAVLASFIAILATSSSAIAQNKKLDFELVNQTGLTINEVYVSPTSADDWEEDVLGRDVLKNGESVEIQFARSETTCSWDLKIVDADNDSVEWAKLDLCSANQITLKYEGKRPTASIK